MIIRTILLAFLVLASGHALAKKDLPFSRIYVLGTSLSDEGSAFVQCGMQSVPPYDNLPVQLVAPGDSPYARGGHHFSNGATWVRTLARELGVTNSVLPARRNPKGTNYAQAGTTASFFPGILPCRTTFGAQVDEVLDREEALTDALVVAEIGSNDIFNALELFAGALIQTGDPAVAQLIAFTTVLQPAAMNTADGIEELIDEGEASTVLWANVPDLGLTPAVAITDAQLAGLGLLSPGEFKDQATEFAQAFNALVQTQLQPLIDDGTIVEFDLFETVQDLVANPGELNVTDPCVTPNIPPFACRDADNHLFWDGTHPTKVGHELFAREALATLGIP